ncbi:winged helix-turn-helix transcriptional regulator [Candidatus Uhrbacteria bacterium]|nr:winged helix-turn-helix transcriptional regulator [Candidatus Uhrbacteria bacterium]
MANENRLKIIHFLARSGPKKVSDIVKGTALEQTAVSHNLTRLLACHFVTLEQNGRERVYAINTETIKPLLSLMDSHVKRFCKRCHIKK